MTEIWQHNVASGLDR